MSQQIRLFLPGNDFVCSKQLRLKKLGQKNVGQNNFLRKKCQKNWVEIFVD